MRAVLILLLIAACGSPSKSRSGSTSSSRPAVIPMLSELPLEAEKRNAILDSANQVAGPEHRKGFTKKERKAETTAATAAAIIGSIFSKSSNVTLGTATVFEENEIVAPNTMKKPRSPGAGDPEEGDSGEKRDGEKPSGPLVPWIKLK